MKSETLLFGFESHCCPFNNVSYLSKKAANNHYFDSMPSYQKALDYEAHHTHCPSIRHFDIHGMATDQTVRLNEENAKQLVGNGSTLFIHGSQASCLQLENAQPLPSLMIEGMIYHPFKLGRVTLFVEANVQVACQYALS